MKQRRSPERLPDPSGAAPTPGLERVSVHTDLRHLGARIRQIRTDRNLKLADVAARTGISLSMISALERGTTNASIGTLIAVADALGISLVELFGMEKGPGPSPVIRSTDQPVVESTTGVRRRLVYRDPGRGIEMAHNEYVPGAWSADKPLRHGGFEFGVVIKGELLVELNGQQHQLRQGDAIAYLSTTPHRIHNPGKRAAQTFWINLYREA